jgi:nicotinic acid mononucleotide adenylyltransferase
MGDDAPKLRLLIGADQAVNFHKWRAPREILRIAPPVVMVRGELEDSGGLGARMRSSRFWGRDELESWRDALLPVGAIHVSATAVRDALSHHEWEEAGRWLAPGVIEWIRERGLYQRPG